MRPRAILMTILATIAVAIAVAIAAQTAAAALADDVDRALDMLFAGGPGAAGGDVNADGRASAADVCGVIRGLRSPTQPGPFGIGVRRITFTKDSASNPGTPRPLETVIWYPTQPGAGPVDPLLGGVVGAPLSTDGGPWPLLMFSHGSCGTPTQSLFFTPFLATYGFVVAAPPHPGNTLQDYPACGTPQGQLESFINRVADISFVVDSLLALNEDESSPFFHGIDAARIGMSGHSFGGQTTLRACAGDARMVAGLALAPSLVAIQTIVPTIHIPMMIQGGDLDTITPFDTNAQVGYDLLSSPKQLVEILNTGHFAFSDVCYPFLPDCFAGTLTQDQAHLYVLRYAVPFLLGRVAADDRFEAFLSTAAVPPGIVLSQELEP